MGILWLLIVAVTVMIVQSFVFRRWVLAKVRYVRFFGTDACFAGDEVELVERIVNLKLLPVPWLRLESMMHRSLRFRKQVNLDISSGIIYQNHRSLFSLMPYTEITRRHKLRADRRGCYELNSVTMTSGDPFGTAYTTKTLKVSARLLVYPKPMPLDEIALPSHKWQGELVVKRWVVDDPFMISGVREYRYGDPLNAVNWKATARSGRLQVHNRDFTSDHELMIYVNVEVSEKMWHAVTDPELIERGIAYAASIAQYAIGQGIPTGFGCNGYDVDAPKMPVRLEAAAGKDQLLAIFETMAKLVIERSIGFDSLLERDVLAGATRTDYLLVTPFVSETMQLHIDRLREYGNAVEILPLSHAGAAEGGEADEAAG